MTSKPSPRILLIEDDEAISDLLSQILEMEGYAISCAKNGEEGIQFLEESEAPHLIICDLMMPLKDGFTFRAEQMAHERWNLIPILIMTADSYLTKEHHNLKPFDFLFKPLQIETALSKVKAALGEK
jgi:DNA-binding response OmpR family regulator